MQNSTLVWLLVVVFSGSYALGQDTDWKLAKSENGIDVYTRQVEGEVLRSFRAETVIDASAESILSVITDFENAIKWQDRCIESRLLRNLSNNRYICYIRIETPWPLEDRDVAIEMQVKEGDGRVVCSMRHSPKAYPKQEGITRMPRYEGRWILIPKKAGQTQVISEGMVSPGGSIPDWLANTGVVDSPYKTIANLRKQLEG